METERNFPWQRGNIMKAVQITLAALSLALLATTAAAQNLQNQLIGTWDFLVAQVKAPDGKISFPLARRRRAS